MGDGDREMEEIGGRLMYAMRKSTWGKDVKQSQH